MRAFLISAVILFHALYVSAQVSVNRLGVEQGLSNETVRSIYQDRKGFMWFGTLDGLNRFDGYGFKVYHNRFGDSSSLSSSVVYGITEDRKGNIWLGTRLGVCCLNLLTDAFSTVEYTDYLLKKTIRLDREVIKTVVCDNQNNILIATELRGLMLCRNASLHAQQIPYVEEDSNQLYQYGVQSICFDRMGRTLVFVQGKGLCILDYGQQKLVLLNGDIKYVNSLLADGDCVWMASNTGVYGYSLSANRLTMHLSVENNKLNSDLAIALSSDGNGNLYIGTMGGGLNVYNEATQQVNRVEGGDGRNDLSSSGIYALFRDKGQRLWIGTRRGGINILDHGRDKITTVSHDASNPNSLSGNFITSLCEMPNGDLLVATEDKGLNLLDKNTNRFIHYRCEPGNPLSLSSDNVNSITRDHLGYVWLSTYTNGICRYDPKIRRFKRYKALNPKTGTENIVFNTCYEDCHGTLWASALRRGNDFGALYLFNRQNDAFEMFDDRLSDLFSLLEDGEGDFWGGGLTDLVKIDRTGHRHRFFYIGQFVRTITDGGNGQLWLGTEGGGLVLFDKKQEKIVARYTTSEGLSNNSIFSTLKDDKGNLWLGTFNGLSMFDIRTKKFKNYYRSDGLESDQFHFNAAVRLRSGAFAFGGIKGYNVFFPDSIGFSGNKAPLRFTGIQIDGKTMESVPDYIDKDSKGDITGLGVPYSHAVFSFGFAALEYSVPDKISYAYRMEGWDKGWNYSGNVRTASYTHLREGRYVFKVKCTDGNGVWQAEISIPVEVFPPWYRSWWAYLLYTAGIVTLVYLYFRYRSRQAQLRYQVSLQKVNLQREKAELETERAQRALEQSERETERALAEKERESNERRASFFTGISHEFRTPLTLIINPIKDMLERRHFLPEKENREMDIVYRNARRMLSLTNQLLLFRREESGLDKVYPIRLDLVALCRDVYLCFVQQAEAKGIAYNFYCYKDSIEVYADKDKLEIIFYNLLSNAMKYTPPKGEVSLYIEESGEGATVQISDNGPGVAPQAVDKIFDKFYQPKGVGKEVKTGFGIGLYLARQFAEAHHGAISYLDRAGGGASFLVQLLKGSAHFTAEQLSHDIVIGESVLCEIADPVTGENKDIALLADVAEDTSILVASEKQSILIVDDDASIREYLTMVLASTYQVYEADNAERGISKAEKLLPDIIISDIVMEEVSGIDLCKAVKGNPALNHIPVILLTGTSNDALKLQGVQQGADDYITKPFDKELLLARVDSLLKNKNNLQRYFYNEITLASQDTKIPEKYREFLEKCIQIVEAHLEDEEFNSKKLAQELGASYSSVTKKVKAMSGQSLNSFVRFLRLRKAARLFIDTNYNVNEVAATVGIYDSRYFREQFSKQFGMNPSIFIKKYRKPFANKFTVNKDILNME